MVDSDKKEPERRVAPENSPGNVDTTMTFSQEFAASLAALDSNVTLEEQEAIAALPSGSALLVVRRGPNSGARFLLDDDVTTVGRHPNADIFLDDVTVSRRHAVLTSGERGITLTDNGSLNGSYVNGDRVDERLLGTGDEVQIGRFKLLFVGGGLDLGGPA